MSHTTEVDEYDNIYLNISIYSSYPNYNPTGPGIPNIQVPPTGNFSTLAEYKAISTSPFLDDPSKYYCSIVRFSVPLQSVPISIMPIVPNTYVSPASPGNPNLSELIFSFDLSFSTLGLFGSISQRVIYVPDNNFTPPLQNSVNQIVTPYYYIYSYNHLIFMLNNTLTSLWNTNFAGPNSLASLFPALSPPYMQYNQDTQLISMVVPYIFTQASKIYVNALLSSFLDGFRYHLVGTQQSFGKDLYFVFDDKPNFYYPQKYVPNPTPPPLSTYYIYTQEYNTLQYWSNVEKILFSSTNIPVVNEITPSGGSQGIYSSFPILTDYIINPPFAGDQRSIAVYNPSGQYRLINMNANYPISSVDIRVLWQDKQGKIYPIYINTGQVISIKIGFFRKSLYKSSSLTTKI